MATGIDGGYTAAQPEPCGESTAVPGGHYATATMRGTLTGGAQLPTGIRPRYYLYTPTHYSVHYAWDTVVGGTPELREVRAEFSARRPTPGPTSPALAGYNLYRWQWAAQPTTDGWPGWVQALVVGQAPVGIAATVATALSTPPRG